MSCTLMLHSLGVFGCTINCAKIELLKNKRRAGAIIVGAILSFERLSITIVFIPVIVMFFPLQKEAFTETAHIVSFFYLLFAFIISTRLLNKDSKEISKISENT